MKDVIEIFNDIVKLGEAIMASENQVKDSKEFIKEFVDDFRSGNVEKAKADCYKLQQCFDEIEENFRNLALEPLIDIYQKMKNIMHLHIGSAEQQLQAFEKQACVKESQYILEKLEGKKDAQQA